MATITLSYDANSSLAQKALDFILSLGLFKASKSASTSSSEKKTMKAIEEINSGKGIVCDSFEDYLKAVQ